MIGHPITVHLKAGEHDQMQKDIKDIYGGGLSAQPSSSAYAKHAILHFASLRKLYQAVMDAANGGLKIESAKDLLRDAGLPWEGK